MSNICTLVLGITLFYSDPAKSSPATSSPGPVKSCPSPLESSPLESRPGVCHSCPVPAHSYVIGWEHPILGDPLIYSLSQHLATLGPVLATVSDPASSYTHVTCHLSLTPTDTATDPPPANSPIFHSRLASKSRKNLRLEKSSKLKEKNCVIAGQY